MANDANGVLIVGGGAAGHACATTLRKLGFMGTVRILDAEANHPINRTLVDTGILPGLLTPSQLALPPIPDVELIAGRAVSIDRAERRVVLADGTALKGDAIVLACGSAPRELDPVIALATEVKVHRLHAAADAQELREALPEPANARVVVLGSGFIGAEVASYYAAAGADVVLLGRSARPLRAAVGNRIAEHLAALHREYVDARFGSDIRAIQVGAGDRAITVTMSDGAQIEADALIVAHGTIPATEWVGERDGISVDSMLRVPQTPGLYAAGSAVVLDFDGEAVRIDHWDDAAAQGAHVARAILHDQFEGQDPGAYLPRTGFTLHVYGTVVAAKGVRASSGIEVDADAHLDAAPEAQRARMLTEFLYREGSLAGVAGVNAGAGVARRSAAIGS